jgi:hypothetical protein
LHKKKKLALIINGLDIASIHIFLIWLFMRYKDDS